MRETLRELWELPAAPNPPRQSWLDWLLAAFLGINGLVIGLTGEPEWRAAVTAVGALTPLVLPWRRSHTLLTVAVAFGAYDLLHLAMLSGGTERQLNDIWVLVVLVYTLGRWTSGRRALLGYAMVAVGVVVAGATAEYTTAQAIWGTASTWIAPALIGAIVRSQAGRRRRRVLQARANERQQLARELHDTIAHDVSAIAIQAQAGRLASRENPSSATAALEAIEGAANHSLGEMRRLVDALREPDVAALAPQEGLADIQRIAGPDPVGPDIEVDLSGDLESLGASLEAGLYRLAQESITNARRHARHATRIGVRIVGSDSDVRMTVTDDGDPVSPVAPRGGGYGLIGMAERARLLGGTFTAGPGPDGGWETVAALPRHGTA